MSETSVEQPKQTAKSERGIYMAVFAVTLSLLAIAVAGFALEKLRKAEFETTSTTAAPNSDQQDKLAKLEQSLDEARGEIAALHTQIAENAPSASNEDTEALKQSVDDVKNELGASQDAVAQDIKRIDEKLASLSTPEQRARIGLSYMLLRERVESGEPYTAELTRLREAMTDAPKEQSFSVLDAHAADGVKTQAMLYSSLQAITLDVPQEPTASAEHSGGSWREQTLHSFSQLVKVERIGDGPSPFATLEEIHTLMKFGDIRETREAILRLPAADQQPFEEWLDAAKARLEVISALQELGLHVLEQPIAPAEPAPATPEAPAHSAAPVQG